MKVSEAQQLLARIAAFDKRTASEIEARAWAETIPNHYQLHDCIQAVILHHRTSTDWMTVGHLCRLVPTVIRDRTDRDARNRGIEPPHKPIPGRATDYAERIKQQLQLRKAAS